MTIIHDISEEFNAVISGKFIDLTTYINKYKRIKINELNSQVQQFLKIKPKKFTKHNKNKQSNEDKKLMR